MIEDSVQSIRDARAGAASGHESIGFAQKVAAFPTRDAGAREVGRVRNWRVAVLCALAFALAAVAYHFLFTALANGVALDFVPGLDRTALELAGFALVACGVLSASRSRSARDARALARREHASLVADRRALAGLAAAAIAHDANNVLCALGGEIELQRALAGREPNDRIDGCIERLIALNRRLLDTARFSARPELAKLDLARVVGDSVAWLRSHPLLRDCRVTVVAAEGLTIDSDASLWHQIVGNLLINAGEATEGRGAIEVRVERRGRELLVEVHDDGPGVAPERRASLFEALASTKPRGSGLGLFSVASCARLLGGCVTVGDSPLGGALFRVSLRSAAA